MTYNFYIKIFKKKELNKLKETHSVYTVVFYKMSLLETIQALDTFPFEEDEEYEYTSNFLEWFYKYMIRDTETNTNIILKAILKEPEYKMMSQLCLYLINKETAQYLDRDTRYMLSDDIKHWLLMRFEENMNVVE